MKAIVFINSKSGTARTHGEIRQYFADYGLSPEFVDIGLLDKSRDKIAESDLVVAAGGDGTLSSVANAIFRSGSDAVMAVLPLGTCNDFAKTVGVSTDLEDAIKVAVDGKVKRIDLIRSGDRTILNQANGGLSGEIAQEVEEQTGKKGVLSYWRASIEVLRDLPRYNVTLSLDGEAVHLRLLNLTVANARYSGGGIPLAPLAQLDDGLMDIVGIKDQQLLSLAPVLPRILTGSHLDSEAVFYKQASSVEIHSEPVMPFSVDGELDEFRTERFEVVREALAIKVGDEVE